MEYRIISSNIRFDNPSDGDHQWKYRKNILAEIINDFKPHLLGTQEGWKPQIYDFLHSLNLKLADNHREWILERMYPCIFYNPEEIEVIESGDIWLSETPEVPASISFNSAFPRLCTWIKGIFKKSQTPFIYVNTHLDHSNEEPRREQIKVLMSEIEKVNSENHPLILSGDFNESPSCDVRKEISERWPSLQDPWFKHKGEEEDSHHKFGIPRNNGSRIDWILLDKKFNATKIKLDKSSKDGIFPSDHYPVKVTFDFCL